MKYLIVGLGNIGPEYQETRHNIGFKILDAYVKASNISFQDKRYGFIAEHKFRGRTLLLLKPSTYMNLSGKAVNYWLQKAKIQVENMLVLVDDIALPMGAIRIRYKGGDGGHNGLQNIIQTLGHQNFNRLRFGVGNDFFAGQQVNYVLGNWSEEEEKMLPERLEICCEVINSFVINGASRTMNLFNNK